jgi:hypothetical protein
MEFNTFGVGIAFAIVTTDVTVAIGIQHLRCCVRKPKVFNSNSHGNVHGTNRNKGYNPEGVE